MNDNQPASPAQGKSLGQIAYLFTPAPWIAVDRGIGWEVFEARFCTGKVYPDAEPLNRGMRETFSEADAHLIAAAPELLEALKAVVAVADRKTVEFDLARAAIARAEGRV